MFFDLFVKTSLKEKQQQHNNNNNKMKSLGQEKIKGKERKKQTNRQRTISLIPHSKKEERKKFKKN